MDTILKLGERNINNLCYANSTGLIAGNANNLKALVMGVKEHSETNEAKIKYKENLTKGNRYSKQPFS